MHILARTQIQASIMPEESKGTIMYRIVKVNKKCKIVNCLFFLKNKSKFGLNNRNLDQDKGRFSKRRPCLLIWGYEPVLSSASSRYSFQYVQLFSIQGKIQVNTCRSLVNWCKTKHH